MDILHTASELKEVLFGVGGGALSGGGGVWWLINKLKRQKPEAINRDGNNVFRAIGLSIPLVGRHYLQLQPHFLLCPLGQRPVHPRIVASPLPVTTTAPKRSP